MADTVLRRITKHGFAVGSTWGTAVVTEALSGVYSQSFSGNEKRKKISPDHSAGQAFESNAAYGTDEPPAPSGMMWMQENDEIALTFLAMIFGDDVVTGGSDPYTHTLAAQNEANIFGTYRWQEGDEVKEIPSLKVDGVTLSHNAEGVLELNFTSKGDEVAVGTSTDLDSCTYSTRSITFGLQNFVLRINDQSGDALDSDDSQPVSDFSLEMNRGSDSVITAGAGTIVEPKEGEFPEFKLMFKLPRKDAFAKTLFNALGTSTLFKADLVWTGSSADRSLTIELPQLFVEACDNPNEDVIPADVTLRVQKAASSPTGMTVTMPTAEWLCGVATAVV